MASFDSAEQETVVPSFVACASSEPPTKSMAREMSSALRVLVPFSSLAQHRRHEVRHAQGVAILVVAARLHGEAEADDRQLLARDDDDLRARSSA